MRFLQAALDAPRADAPAGGPSLWDPSQASQLAFDGLAGGELAGGQPAVAVADVHELVVAGAACFLVLGDGERYLVGVASAAAVDTAAWVARVRPRWGRPRRAVRAAFLTHKGMVPAPAAALDKRLLRYIEAINGQPSVLRVDSVLFQGLGPLFASPPLVHFDEFAGSPEPVHDSFYDATPKETAFVGVRPERFRPLSDSDSLESLDPDLDIPASIPAEEND